MYANLSRLLYLWEEQRAWGRGVKFIVWRDAEGGAKKSQSEKESFHGGVDPSTILSNLAYLSLGLV